MVEGEQAAGEGGGITLLGAARTPDVMSLFVTVGSFDAGAGDGIGLVYVGCRILSVAASRGLIAACGRVRRWWQVETTNLLCGNLDVDFPCHLSTYAASPCLR